MSSLGQRHAFIVCDMQPDFLGSISEREVLLDFIRVALAAARLASYKVLCTGVRFSSDYAEVNVQHKLFGALKRLYQANKSISWFAGDGSNIEASLQVQESQQSQETVLYRHNLLPTNNSQELLDALQDVTKAIVVGIKASTTVNVICQLVGDALCIPVAVIDECVGDETQERRDAVLSHVLPVFAERMSLSEFMEYACALERSFLPEAPSTIQYYSDCKRGGHSQLYFSHLQRRGYRPWPIQLWYEEALTGKIYYCPLARRVIDFCDEPKFSKLSMYVLGRENLDEKDKLAALVPDLVPQTFATINDARTAPDSVSLWFYKATNKNGGRAVTVHRNLDDSVAKIDEDESFIVQAHVPDPCLYQARKCHIKTYQYLSCDNSKNWELYMYRTAYLSIASKSWDPADTSNEAQITTLRDLGLQKSQPVESWPAWMEMDVYGKCQHAIALVITEAVNQGGLKPRDKTQFEIFSADWMLDITGRLYLIECNFTPVLYDPHSGQELTTRGLRLYDKLYREDPDLAPVNDHGMVRDALSLALGETLPSDSKWERVKCCPLLKTR